MAKNSLQTLITHHSAKTKDLLEKAVNWLEQGYQVAMLTLVSVEGSAPYPIGTQMLVRGDGEYLGQITGGCVEPALVEQAKILMTYKENTIERYGLNSRFFDIQLPCGSGLDIEFDVQTNLEDYRSIKEQVKQRKVVRINEFKNYKPIPRLLLFGQGPIVECLIELANNVGFDVLIFDYKQSYNFQDYCDSHTAVVSLFHEHEYETQFLFELLQQPYFYIGALGSRATHAARLETLISLGAKVDEINKIHGPIGININSQTPAQIAVSIIAQIISVMNQSG